MGGGAKNISQRNCRGENVMDVAKKLTPQEFRTMQLLELDSLHLISDEI